MTGSAVNWALTGDPKKDLAEAQRQLNSIRNDIREVIRILTAEQALKAQRVVKQAGKNAR